MDAINLAELRLWLNRSRRKDWSIQTTRYDPNNGGPRRTDLVTSPGHRIQIGLCQSRKEGWRAWLSVQADQPGTRNKGPYYLSISGDTAADACRNAIEDAKASGLIP